MPVIVIWLPTVVIMLLRYVRTFYTLHIRIIVNIIYSFIQKNYTTLYCTVDIHIENMKLQVLYSNCQCSLTPTSHPVLKTTWSLNQIAFKAIDIMSLRQLDVHIVRPLNVHVSIQINTFLFCAISNWGLLQHVLPLLTLTSYLFWFYIIDTSKATPPQIMYWCLPMAKQGEISTWTSISTVYQNNNNIFVNVLFP